MARWLNYFVVDYSCVNSSQLVYGDIERYRPQSLIGFQRIDYSAG